MCGIAPWHIRVLTDNHWEGGAGYTTRQVRDMTLDEIFMRLAKRDNLRRRGKTRTSIVGSDAVLALVHDDGTIHGRDAHGNLIKGKVTGESVAARLAREEREKAEAEAQKKSRRKGKRRGN